jgi:hypothetical protein
MSTRDLKRLVEQIRAEMGAKNFERFVREVRQGKHGRMKDLPKRRRDEARALMAAYIVISENDPDEGMYEAGRETVFKRRGQIVVRDADGTWKVAPKMKVAAKKIIGGRTGKSR